ncbi:MAG: large subunit ribosomal protein [Patescibacteria group bacterium]|nr:large subunit ribosomal protein [Patescibacteria group bacterium]
MTSSTYTIDATNKALGRLASEAAALLNAKNNIAFVKNKAFPVTVKIVNASKVKVTGKKMQDAVHKSYSGYPGGLKEKSLAHVVEHKGFSEIIKHAVYGMLPKNRLQDVRIKNLVIED